MSDGLGLGEGEISPRPKVKLTSSEVHRLLPPSPPTTSTQPDHLPSRTLQDGPQTPPCLPSSHPYSCVVPPSSVVLLLLFVELTPLGPSTSILPSSLSSSSITLFSLLPSPLPLHHLPDRPSFHPSPEPSFSHLPIDSSPRFNLDLNSSDSSTDLRPPSLTLSNRSAQGGWHGDRARTRGVGLH